MRRFLFVVGFALVASLIFATTAVAAQDVEPGKVVDPASETEELFGQQEVIETPVEEAIEEPVEEAIGADQPEPKAEEAIEEQAQQQVGVTGEATAVPQGEQGKAIIKVEETIPGTAGPLPKSGGPGTGSLLLPVAALLLGSGILAYAVMRRR